VRESSPPEREPRWLSRASIEAIHAALIQEHGGSYGIRDEGLIDSALARPHNKWAYGTTDLAELAAAYGFGLAKNHGFVDGNKRIAFAALAVFLYQNGLLLDAPEAEAAAVMLEVAAGECGEQDLADWIRARVTPVR
jgi:death-on-curing protein